MKKVLLPTDFSRNSLNAIFYAISLLADKKIKFILLNAYQIGPVSIEEYVNDIPDFASRSEKGLKKVINTIKKKFPHQSPSIEIFSKLGNPVDVMEKIVRNKKIDLTIMGTKGASGLREVLVGSITSDAIKKIPCPIIAVPEKARFKMLKNIAFATDLKKINKEKKLDLLLFLAKKFSSEILILHVTEKKTINRTEDKSLRLNKLFAKFPHSFHVIEENNVIKGLENYIRSGDIDMLSLISRKHSFIGKLFNKSVTKKLSMHTRIPLLVLQN